MRKETGPGRSPSGQSQLLTNVPGLPEAAMAQPGFTRLVEPDPGLAAELERFLKEFVQLVLGSQGAGRVEVIPRYQDGPIWLVRRHVPEKGLLSGVQIAFFETALGQEADLIPFVWLDLGEDGTRIQPSVPPESIRRLHSLPSPEQRPKWFSLFSEELSKAWSIAETWAIDPDWYATEHHPRLAPTG